MRIALKFAGVLLAGICLILALAVRLQVDREIGLFENDMASDHRVIGHALAVATAEVWKTSGEAASQDFLRRANLETSGVAIQWVPLDRDTEASAHVPMQRIQELEQGRSAEWIDGSDAQSRRMRTWTPVMIGGRREGEIELSESLAPEQQYTRASVLRNAAAAGAIVAQCGAMALGLGVLLIGLPVRALVQTTRRIGTGDFSARAALTHRDELSELAVEINHMSVRLGEAQERLNAETAARIASVEQLRRADRLMTVGKLASGVAHELGTPLNVVSARAKMIATGEVEGHAARDNARIISEQSSRIGKIIRQLLDFARPRRPAREPVDLRQLLRQSASLLSPIAAPRHVSFEMVGPETPAIASVDAAQIQQVVSNLMVNAIHAMPKGGRAHIGVQIVRRQPPADLPGPESEYLRIEVRDDGTGISEDDLLHIFEPFFTTKDVGEGTGLGLSVSLGIVREHGGWIDVESRVGAGSCFSVFLPLEPPDARPPADRG